MGPSLALDLVAKLPLQYGQHLSGLQRREGIRHAASVEQPGMPRRQCGHAATPASGPRSLAVACVPVRACPRTPRCLAAPADQQPTVCTDLCTRRSGIVRDRGDPQSCPKMLYRRSLRPARRSQTIRDARDGRRTAHNPATAGGQRRGRRKPAVRTPIDRVASLGLTLVRIVIARCSVDYTSRLSAHLPFATRLIIIKADGSVVIHNDAGTKALNWMPTGSRLAVAPAQVPSNPVQESDSDGGSWNRISC